MGENWALRGLTIDEMKALLLDAGRFDSGMIGYAQHDIVAALDRLTALERERETWEMARLANETREAAMVDAADRIIVLREALAELVRLKDGPKDAAYYATRELAWEAAREALKET